MFSFWCDADFQQRSNERLVVLPQTRSNSIHSVENLFRLSAMQPFQKHSSWWLGSAPQHPLSRPSSFFGVKHLFVVMLCRLSTTFKWTAGRAPPNTVQLLSQCWVNFSSAWLEAFQKHSNFRLGRPPSNTAQILSRCWWNFSFRCYAAISKTFKLMAGPRFPTSPVTAQLISRHKTWVSFWCDANFQQRSNERLVVLPKHGPAQITVLSQLFVRMAWSFWKTFEILDGSCSPKHGPYLFTVLKNLFVWVLRNHLKTFKLMAGPRSPISSVTAQLILRR